MKKIIFIILGILLIGGALFFFFGGKTKINQILNNEVDFGTFFDINTPSSNNFQETPPPIIDPSITNPNLPYEAPVLRQISFEPVSGYTYYSTSTVTQVSRFDESNNEIIEEVTSTSTAIRFQERATGHIYDVFEFAFAPKLISNITLPRIYETLFASNTNQFVYKNLSTDNEQIISRLGTLSFSTSTNPEDTSFVPELNFQSLDLSTIIDQMIYNKSINKLVYSVKQNNVSTIFTSNLDRTNEKTVRSLPFNDFLISNINQNEVLITTKASSDAVGYAYSLNLNTGAFSKLLGDIRGMTVQVSPSKEYIIYSEANQNRPITRLLNTNLKFASQIFIDTLPSEKCVFAQPNTVTAYCFGSLIYRSASYPDDWYKGKVTNIEDLYEINLISGETTPVFYFDEDQNLTQTFDVMNVSITPNDSHIIFQNKNDLTLWAIDLVKMNRESF